MEAAIASITTVYAKNVRASPPRVPFGIALLGYWRSPDMLAPLDSDVSRSKEHCEALSQDSTASAHSRKYATSSREKDSEQRSKAFLPGSLTTGRIFYEPWEKIGFEGFKSYAGELDTKAPALKGFPEKRGYRDTEGCHKQDGEKTVATSSKYATSC